ncbi:MAG TPA: trehalase family glycosidase, partial [Anaerolineales bacterium]
LMLFRSNDHFTVRLAERWFKLQGQLAAYRDRPPLIENWSFTDAEGMQLEFQLTTYPHRLDCSTRVGTFSITFVDAETLLIALPACECGMKFDANLDNVLPDRRGGVLRLTGDIRRNVAYTTDARILRDDARSLDVNNQSVHLQLDASEGNKSILLNITPRLGFNRYIPNPAEAMEAAAWRWHDWFAAAPPVVDEYRSQYYYAWWVMRAGLISTRYFTTREAMTPSKFYYVGVWQWDAFFHALAYRYVNKRLAQDQLRILLDHQREDGMLPDAVHDEGVVTHLDSPVDADVTKPPLLAWAVWKLYEQDGDLEFLQEIYEPLVRWNNWWFEHNDTEGDGLCEYLHPYSSGLDDSPLWDEGMPVESPDLNTYLCIQQQALAKIAAAIGEVEAANLWSRRADDLAQRMIEILWDEKAGIFWAKRKGQPVTVRTPFSLFPLLTGRMPPAIASRLVEHLTDESQFWPRYPVPSVALCDPKYDPNQMWRGPTWVNINYLVIEGLQKAGYPGIAKELRRRTLDLIGGQQDIFEYYHPETGQNPPKAAAIFGWSSAVFIDLAIQATQEGDPAKGKPPA